MKTKRIKSVICLLLLNFTLFSLFSCGGKVGEDEALDIANDLILRAYVLNVVCYGEGLEADEELFPDDTRKYAYVSENAPFQTKSELENELYDVFSADLAENMYEICFSGQQGIASGTGNYARYTYYSDEEFLKVYKYIEGFKIGVPDTTKTTITKIKSKKIIGVITYQDGESVEFTLKKEKNNWKLDTLTF